MVRPILKKEPNRAQTPSDGDFWVPTDERGPHDNAVADDVLKGLGLIHDPVRDNLDLLGFIQWTYPDYVADKMHVLICDELQGMIDGEFDRLMVFAPPQHGKSQICSVHLPAYILGKFPNDPVMITSYGADLAESKSREIRSLIEDNPTYQRLFPDIAIRQNSRAVDQWHLKGYRGGIKAAGVGGPITGWPAMWGIIDDPFANWAAAQSETLRNSIHEWYKGVFRTRIREGGKIIFIMTRWHKDDLAGRLLRDQPDEWRVLRLPAIAETQDERDRANRYLGMPEGEADPLGRQAGEAVAPRRFSIQSLERLKRDVGAMTWAAEYQQVPRDPEGNRFKRAWFPIVAATPARLKLVRYWDKSGTTKRDAPYTAGVLLGISPEGFIYILDTVRGQWSAYDREKIIKQTAQLDALNFGNVVRIVVEQEPGSGGLESAQNTIRNLQGFPIFADKPTGSKDVRLEPFAAQCEAGNVRLREGKWNTDYLEEFLSVPYGEFRDQTDATSGAYNRACDIKRRFSARVPAAVVNRNTEKQIPYGSGSPFAPVSPLNNVIPPNLLGTARRGGAK